MTAIGTDCLKCFSATSTFNIAYNLDMLARIFPVTRPNDVFTGMVHVMNMEENALGANAKGAALLMAKYTTEPEEVLHFFHQSYKPYCYCMGTAMRSLGLKEMDVAPREVAAALREDHGADGRLLAAGGGQVHRGDGQAPAAAAAVGHATKVRPRPSHLLRGALSNCCGGAG